MRLEHVTIPDHGKLVPDAFHGTSKESAESIIDSGFLPSRNEDGWLGRGVYFFEASKTCAVNWAKRKHIGPNDIAVVQAKVELGRCLDFANKAIIAIIKQFESRLRQRGKETTDAAIIELISSITTVHSTRAIRQRNPQIVKNSRFSDSQIFLCVRDTSKIIERKIAEE